MHRFTPFFFAPSDGVGSSVGNVEPRPDGSVPTQQLTIQKFTFTIPAPYAAGPIELTDGEAAALNQTYAENIRNNFAAQMKKAAEGETPKELGQTELDVYVASYEFGKRSTGMRSRDPVGVEERRLAREAINALILSKGKKLKDYSTEQMNTMLGKVVESGKFRAQAEAVVAARGAVAVDPLADLEIPEAAPAAAA